MRFLRAIIKFILFGIVGLLGLMVLLVILLVLPYFILPEVPLNPEITTFYTQDPDAYKQDNAMVAIMGLAAPADVTDTYAWALEQITNHSKEDAPLHSAEARAKEYASSNRLVTMLHVMFDKNGDFILAPIGISSNSKPAELPKLEAQQEKFMFTLGREKTPCLPTIAQLNSTDNKLCRQEQDWPTVLQNYALFLDRYKELHKYTHFINSNEGDGLYFGPLIGIHSWYLAQLWLQSKQQPDAALDALLDDMQLWQHAFSEPNNLITRSVVMVLHHQCQNLLPTFLQSVPALTSTQQQKVLAMLQPLPPETWNIEGIMKAEYADIRPIIEPMDNYSRNKFYSFQQDMISLAKFSPSVLPEQRKAFDQRWRLPYSVSASDWRSPILGVLTNMIISGVSLADSLFMSMHKRDAENRLLHLYVQIETQHIAPPDIPTFLAASPAEFYDPFTNQPFRYDTAKNAIYYSMPGDQPVTWGLVLN